MCTFFFLVSPSSFLPSVPPQSRVLTVFLTSPLYLLSIGFAVYSFEGSLIRAFRRLQELLRQMAQAAKAIGNTELEEKFGKSSEMLERPGTVVFSQSLYL
jgi:hypothetical protein